MIHDQYPDKLSQLILEADGLMLLLQRHREETPSDVIALLRNKLQLILSLIDGLDDTAPAAPANDLKDPKDLKAAEAPAEYIEDTVEGAAVDSAASRPRRPASSVFNLNDKFRFRRELFGNSEMAYTECIDMLTAMHSLDEAKDYLYQDLQWDPDNEDVIAFVDLLSNYYD